MKEMAGGQWDDEGVRLAWWQTNEVPCFCIFIFFPFASDLFGMSYPFPFFCPLYFSLPCFAKLLSLRLCIHPAFFFSFSSSLCSPLLLFFLSWFLSLLPHDHPPPHLLFHFCHSSSLYLLPSLHPCIQRVVCAVASTPAESAAFLSDALTSLSYITMLGLLPWPSPFTG